MFEIAGSGIVAALLLATASADELVDPMRPYTPDTPIERSAGGRNFALSAILYSADRRVAVVNGQPVSEGQKVNGARVRLIGRGRVELELNGEVLKLELGTQRKTK